MKKSGFTLIELSIVLIIIGLVIGGVLVGQDLIKAAELRATISQLEKFNTAATTFKLKYGYLPGDIPPTTAGALGFFQITGNCGSTCPYGDGFIDSNGSPAMVYEEWAFWRHLSDANLIEGAYGMGTALDSATGYILTGNGNLLYPETKYIKNNYWRMYGLGYNRFVVNGGSAIYTSQHNHFLFTDNTLSPMQAFSIDNKIDDGKPITGNVFDEDGLNNGSWASDPTEGYCFYGGADSFSSDIKYNIDPATGGNTPTTDNMCSIYIQAGF